MSIVLLLYVRASSSRTFVSENFPGTRISGGAGGSVGAAVGSAVFASATVPSVGPGTVAGLAASVVFDRLISSISTTSSVSTAVADSDCCADTASAVSAAFGFPHAISNKHAAAHNTIRFMKIPYLSSVSHYTRQMRLKRKKSVSDL